VREGTRWRGGRKGEGAGRSRRYRFIDINDTCCYVIVTLCIIGDRRRCGSRAYPKMRRGITRQDTLSRKSVTHYQCSGC